MSSHAAAHELAARRKRDLLDKPVSVGRLIAAMRAALASCQ
jgi:hypothetical protein